MHKNIRAAAFRPTLLAALLAAQGMAAEAATLAYWRFEGDGANVPVAGSTQVEDTNGRATTATGTGIRVKDVSGNGNDMWAWDHAWAGHTYQSAVPATVIPQTGDSNGFSVRNAGSYPALFTWSKQSQPKVDIETVTPLRWTIEASINLTSLGGNQTFVGRDGNGVGSDGSAAPLYFQTVNGVVTIIFTDKSGQQYRVSDSGGALQANTWYNVAAVSDGVTLRLYRDSGSGYALVGSTGLGSGDRRLAYDTAGSSSAGDTQWGWTVGRGRYGSGNGQGDNHADRFFGYIDEVRISDEALTPDRFLFSRPAVSPATRLRPGTVTLAVLPDTQNASRYDPRIYNAQTQWIVDNAARLEIPITLHLGDVVDQHGVTAQWQAADTAMKKLDAAGLPYSILPGNHDVYSSGQWDNARTASRENYLSWFGTRRVNRNPATFGGRDPLGYAEYHLIEAQGQRFLTLALGWNSTTQTLDWAKRVMAAYPDLPVILTSHQVIDIQADEVSPLWTSYGNYVWDNLIKSSNQIFVVLSGHHHGAARDIRSNDAGNPVLFMVVDYQVGYQGGNGDMRLLQLDLADNRISTLDFSPWVMAKAGSGQALNHLDRAMRTGPQETFSIDFDLASRIAGISGRRPDFASNDSAPDALALVRADIAALPAAPVLQHVPAQGDLDYPQVQETLAHWRFDGQADGDPVPAGMPLFVDVSGQGNDLVRVDFNGPDEQALVFSSDAHPGSASRGSVCFAGGGRDGAPGAYLTTFEGMPLGTESFRKGYTFEAFFKLSRNFNADLNRWSGIISRVETGAEAGRGGGDAGESAAGLNISNIREVQWATFPASRSDMQTAWSFEIPRETWHHVAAVNDGKEIRLYIDGVTDFRNPTVSDAAGLAASAMGAGWMLGASHYEHGPYIFNGCIGEVRISGRALAPSEFLYQRAH